MALTVTGGTAVCPTSIGTLDIAHGQGSAPQLLIIWAHRRNTFGSINGEAQFCFGFSAGATKGEACWVHDFSVAGNVSWISHNDVLRVADLATEEIEANTSAVDGTNWTLNFSNVDLARTFGWMAIGNLTEAVVVGDESPTSAGDQTVAHGMGGTPDAVIMVHTGLSGTPPLSGATIGSFGFYDGTTNAVSSVFSTDTDSSRYQDQTNGMQMLWSSQSDLELGAISAVDGTNVTITWSKVHASVREFFLVCLRGVQAEVGSDTQRTSVGTKDTATAFDPELVLLTTVMNTASASINTGNRLCFGAGDGTSNLSISEGVVDAYSNRSHAGDSISSSSVAIQMMTPGTGAATVEAEAAVSALGTQLFTLNWTTADAVAREFNYLALAQTAAAGGTILPQMMQH